MLEMYEGKPAATGEPYEALLPPNSDCQKRRVCKSLMPRDSDDGHGRPKHTRNIASKDERNYIANNR